MNMQEMSIFSMLSSICLLLIPVILIRMYWKDIIGFAKAKVANIPEDLKENEVANILEGLKENEVVVTRIGKPYNAVDSRYYRTISFNDGGSVIAKAQYQGHDKWTNIKIGDKVAKTKLSDSTDYEPISMM